MKHVLPLLPYNYSALEPHMGTKTMMLHHDRHHGTHVASLNSALESVPVLQEQSALWLLFNLSEVPTDARVAVRDNLGGHIKHSLFWRTMTAPGGGAVTGPLLDGGELHVYTTSGHDNPLTQGHIPILVNDVWEHAHDLNYANRRLDYLKGWWPLASDGGAAHSATV